jgi:hypothetical protein
VVVRAAGRSDLARDACDGLAQRPVGQTRAASHRLRVRLAWPTPYLFELPDPQFGAGRSPDAVGRPVRLLERVHLEEDWEGKRNPADESTSVGRNSETPVGQAGVDIRMSRRFALGRWGAFEAMVAFNLFNRVNFIEETNQSSFVVFGSDPYPANRLPAYGRYTLTMPPRQVQLAARVTF